MSPVPGSPLSPPQCQALVLQYEPAAVRLFVQMMDPTFVCTVSVLVPGSPSGPAWRGQRLLMEDFSFSLPPSSSAMQKIKACDSGKEDLLGSAPCAWGPQYWCKNMATAVECNVSVTRVPSSPWEGLASLPRAVLASQRHSCPVPPAGCGTLPAPRVELGAISAAGRTCSAVWFGIPAPFPRDVPALTDGHGRSQPGNPSGLGHFLFHSRGLDFQIRLRDSLIFSGLGIQALMSLRVTAKSPASIPTSISIPNPLSTSPSHPESLVKPRSCNVDLSPWAGLGSAAQTPAPHSWLATPASPEHTRKEFGCKDFLPHPHPCCGGPVLTQPWWRGQRGAGSSLPAVPGDACSAWSWACMGASHHK